MRRLILLLAIASLAVLAAAGFAFAASNEKFEADLAGGNEVPPVATGAAGEAEFESRNGALDYKLEAEEIENVVAGHIHLGAAGVNGPVVVNLISDEACEFDRDEVECEGIITEADLVNDLAGQPLDDLLDAMRSGNTYTNVHTVQNPGGEIRGQNFLD